MTPARYTRAQILEAERYACCHDAPDEYPMYSYDGINFWRHPAVFRRELIPAGHAPVAGWWHRAECNCGLCRERDD